MNKKELLKKILPGILPLFVFIIADELWDTRIAVVLAVIFGILEFFYTLIKQKRIDKFILSDTVLLALFGVVSILLDNDVFFKLKPAFIELILCTILGISVFSSKNLMLSMSKRYMKDVKMNDFQLKQMNRSIRILFYIFIVHTLLIVYSVYFMSNEAWAFISGALFYIIFVAYFLYEFIQNKIRVNKT
ncbi:MAG: septation protein IspZ [Bacteroidota bacterium]|nr:septation protein IspZ [Bacteroidota bacterium]